MQRYRIADLQIDMNPSGRTKQQAAAYAAPAEGAPDLVLRCDPQQILQHYPALKNLDDAEYAGTGAQFSYELSRFGGLMLHASAVELGGKAYLFSAPSGTGKSTHTGRWVRLFGAAYLNDDKPALRLVDGVWMAYGTPWSGKHDLSTPRGIPLGGIAVLSRGEENTIAPMAPAEALPWLMSQTVYKLPAKRMERLLSLLDDLLVHIPVWKLSCRNDDDGAILSHSVMTR